MQSVHHAFIEQKQAICVSGRCKFYPGPPRAVLAVPLVSSIEVAREPSCGVAHPPRVHGALLLRLPLCRRRYSRLVDDAFGMANGEQATFRNAGSASS